MPKPKFCPFGFYSFFVSKEQAQAGGCHHCLEQKCGLWESYYDDEGNLVGQCSILGAAESLRAIADTISDISENRPLVETILSNQSVDRPVRKLETFLDKLRNKKTTPETQAPVVEQTIPSPVEQMVKVEQTPITEVLKVEPPKPAIDDLNTLLNPPPISPTELPVVSKKSDSAESPIGGSLP